VPYSADVSLEGLMILAILLQDNPEDRIDIEGFDTLPYLMGDKLAPGLKPQRVTLDERREELTVDSEGPPTEKCIPMSIRGCSDFIFHERRVKLAGFQSKSTIFTGEDF